ncbi:hypothetical protein SNL152K_6212 [Streptomyces sp. NL15-2K]|nr:hypothetical protein SNL152K_6212 [Streptomyces sp. NL15-2K]
MRGRPEHTSTEPSPHSIRAPPLSRRAQGPECSAERGCVFATCQ